MGSYCRRSSITSCPSLNFFLEPEPSFFGFVFLREPEPELFGFPFWGGARAFFCFVFMGEPEPELRVTV